MTNGSFQQAHGDGNDEHSRVEVEDADVEGPEVVEHFREQVPPQANIGGDFVKFEHGGVTRKELGWRGVDERENKEKGRGHKEEAETLAV